MIICFGMYGYRNFESPRVILDQRWQSITVETGDELTGFRDIYPLKEIQQIEAQRPIPFLPVWKATIVFKSGYSTTLPVLTSTSKKRIHRKIEELRQFSNGNNPG